MFAGVLRNLEERRIAVVTAAWDRAEDARVSA
jgi:hypothetical protein